MGTTSGEPVTGSAIDLAARPKTSATSASVIDLGAAVPSATMRAVLHGDEVVGVAGGEVEVVQHHHDGAAALAVEVGEQVEHLDLVGEVEEGRRLVEQQRGRCPGRAPSRSRPAGAGRRRARRRARSAQVERCRSTRSAASTTSSSSVRPLPEPALVRVPAAADEVGDGDARRARSGCCGSSAEPLRDLAGRQSRGSARRRAAPCPRSGVSSRASAAQQRRLAAARWRRRSP